MRWLRRAAQAMHRRHERLAPLRNIGQPGQVELHLLRHGRQGIEVHPRWVAEAIAREHAMIQRLGRSLGPLVPEIHERFAFLMDPP